jgi:hypothetical protein
MSEDLEAMINALPDLDLLEELDKSHTQLTSLRSELLHAEAVNRGFIRPADMEED